MSFPWYALIMENSQIFEVPLDSPIDYDSADMLSPASNPTLSLNRQQYQGSVLPNSLRYEHDGYFAGEHAHEFNHVAGAKIKDNKNKEYTVLKHQAYYAPVYHVESVDGAFAFDYYPLTTVIQSNEPVIIDNSNPSYFRLDGIASIDRDSFAVTPDSGFELIAHTFDPKLFVHDFVFVDKNSVINDNVTITCGKDSQLGFDIFPYSYTHGTHKWGDQYTLNDKNDFSSSDGTISNVAIDDSTVSFDYDTILSVVDSISITMDSVFDFKLNSSSFDTTMPTDNFSVETVSNVTSVYIPTWWSINGLNKSAYNGYTQLPIHDKESTIVMYKGSSEQKKLYVKMKIDFAKVRAVTKFDSITFDIDDVEMPVIEQMKLFAYDKTISIREPVITKEDSYVAGYAYPHNCLFTIKYYTDYTRFNLRIPSIKFVVSDEEGNHAEIKIHNFPICVDIDDFTDHNKNNWAAFKKNCNNPNVVFNYITNADKSIPMINEEDVSIVDSVGLTKDDIITLIQAINNNLSATISYDVYNCIEQVGDPDSSYFNGDGKCVICLEDPYVYFFVGTTFLSPETQLHCPWTKYYASRISVNSVESIVDMFQLQAVNGDKVSPDSDMYCERHFDGVYVNIPLYLDGMQSTKDERLPFKYNGAAARSDKYLHLISPYTFDVPLVLGNMLGAYLVYFMNGKLASDQRDNKLYRAVLRLNTFGRKSDINNSMYTVAYDPNASLTFSEGDSSAIQVTAEYALSKYLKSIVTQEVLDKLKWTVTIPYVFMEVTNNFNTLKQDHTIIERPRAQNMTYCKFNSLDDINHFFFQGGGASPESDYYLLKDSSYKGNAAPICKFLQSGSATSEKPQYFALLINGKLSIETFIDEQAQQIDGKVIDTEPKGMILDLQDTFTISDKGYKYDRINGKAVLQMGITGRIYDYLGDGQYPTDPTNVPQYIKMGSVDYNLASDGSSTVYTLGRDDSLYISTTYNVKEYRHVASASITTSNEWQHGLSTDLANTSVSVDNDVIYVLRDGTAQLCDVIHVLCDDTAQSYDIQFDIATYKATVQNLNGATFIENDVGNYTVKRNKSYNEHITLTKAKLDTAITLVLDSVIGDVYTVSGYEHEIMFSKGDKYFDINSAFDAITVDNVVFNADNISFNISGNKVISAMITIEDIYNLKGITRGTISNDTITFNS